ncbi:MAG TPA: LacI family DNA-binding transcriptional regulator [Victivallales bacterium]|nr:LacI family DNA-binding transcriptional regulator [Victivallales bacterium]
MRTTIKDIARIAGVNISTVSRSLHGSILVAEKTRKKILKIAEELDFEFNSSAQNLITKNTNIIGIIYPGDLDDFALGMFLSSMLTKIREELEKKSHFAIMAPPENNYSKLSNIKKMINGGYVDGLIIINWMISKEDWDCIIKKNVPHIFLHHIPNKYSDRSTLVVNDNYVGGVLAAKYLISLGHKSIFCIASKGKGKEFKNRIEGYFSELKKNKMEDNQSNIVFGECTFDFAYNQTLKMEKELKNKKYSAIFALSDAMALGVLKACNTMGINIPGDLSLLGYDGHEIGNIIYPQLTTIKQPVDALVKEGCSCLINQISNKKIDIKKILIPPSIIEGESCREI